VADYPFTTLVPNLGVVGVDSDSSFVMADIPGIIEGAADGAGLGAQFLRHLSRTRVLLHLVDAAPMDGTDPLENAQIVEEEVGAYSAALLERPIWTVLTKIDLIDDEKRKDLLAELTGLFPHRPTFAVSAATREGLGRLTDALREEIAAIRERLVDDPTYAEEQAALADRIHQDVLASALDVRPRRHSPAVEKDSDDIIEGADEDIGDDDAEVVYVNE
jgi:GTP-binding protein